MLNQLIPPNLIILWDRNRSLIIRIGGVLGVIALGALLAPRVSRSEMLLYAFVGLIGAVALAVILLREPGIGFPLLIAASLVVPFSIGTGTQTSVSLAILIVVLMLGLWVLQVITDRRSYLLIPNSLLVPAILLIVTTVVSFTFGQQMWYPTQPASIAAQLGGTAIFILSAGAFLVSANRLELPWLKRTVVLFLILGTVFILGSSTSLLRRYTYMIYQRAVMDSMFWMWMSIITFSQAYLNRSLSIPTRIGLIVVSLSTLYITFVIKQSWSSGWLPSVAAIGFLLLITRPRLGVFSILLGGAALAVRSQAVQSFLLAGDNAFSLETRLEAWKIVGQIILNNPLFGLGPANYYWFTPYYSILGYHVNFNSHNNYVDILAQIGLVGLIIFFWLLWVIFRFIWNHRNRVPSGFQQAFLYGALGGLVGMVVAGMLGDWVIPFVYNIGMEGFRASVLSWVFLGGAVTLGLRAAKTPLNLDIDF